MEETPRDFPLAELLQLGDGTNVEWEAVGRGDPLLWIEGGPGFWAHMARPDVGLIADRFRCHLVNAPGCGRTSSPRDGDYGLDAHVRFFERVREALGLESLTLMGHSWGGLVAVAYAATYPNRVDRLIVIDGYIGSESVDAGETQREQEAALARLADYDWLEGALAAVEGYAATEAEQIALFSPAWPLYFADPESDVALLHIDRLRREVRWNLDAGRAWEPEPAVDLRPVLSGITSPTLVVVGEHDFICGPAWNRPIADGIRGARLVVIEGAGHLPQYEKPEIFRHVLGEWLDAAPAEGAAAGD